MYRGIMRARDLGNYNPTPHPSKYIHGISHNRDGCGEPRRHSFTQKSSY